MGPGAPDPKAGGPGQPGPGPAGGGSRAEAPKLFVKSDESWKEEAQREKERLARKTVAEEAIRELPPPTFAGFVAELGVQAMLALGLLEIEGGGKPRVDLPAARYTIDLLGILEEKSRGNLSPGEKRHLEELLHSLRIHFARAAKLAADEAKKVQEPPKKIIT